MSKGEEIVEEIVKDRKAVRRLAEAIVSDADVRLAVVNAILRDVATKEDVEKSREATKADIERLRAETKADIEKLRGYLEGKITETRGYLEGKIDDKFDALNKRIDDVNKRIDDVNRRIDDVNAQVRDLREDMRTYFYGFMGGIVATIIAVILTRFL